MDEFYYEHIIPWVTLCNKIIVCFYKCLLLCTRSGGVALVKKSCNFRDDLISNAFMNALPFETSDQHFPPYGRLYVATDDGRTFSEESQAKTRPSSLGVSDPQGLVS